MNTNNVSVNATATPGYMPGANFMDAQGNPMSDPTQIVPQQRRKMRAYMKRLATATRLGIPVNSVGKYRAGRIAPLSVWEAKLEKRRADRLNYKKARQGHFKRVNEANSHL
jgi:hypothetical protein